MIWEFFEDGEILYFSSSLLSTVANVGIFWKDFLKAVGFKFVIEQVIYKLVFIIFLFIVSIEILFFIS